MPSSTQRSGTFARLLAEAIETNEYSLTDCVSMLAEYGVGTTAATLSYWRSGQSLPYRKVSKRAVEALEEILHLESGVLTDALQVDIEAASAVARAEAAISGNAPYNSDTEIIRLFGGLDASLDWEDEAIREMLEEEYLISADFRSMRVRITLLARIPDLFTSPTLHVSSMWDAANSFYPEPDDIGVYEVEGATVGETATEILPDALCKTTTLYLPSTLPPNTLHRIYYEQGYRMRTPVIESPMRIFSWPIRFYTARVTFEGELPASIKWNLRKVDDKGDLTERIVTSRQLKPMNKTVQASVENIANAVSDFTWDEPPVSLGALL